MAFQALSVGDLVMIAQTAWRIGRAFKSAPAELAQVERELNDLGNVLNLADKTLRASDSILSRANPETLQSVRSIFESAERSLKDLEAVLKKYEIIKKPQDHADPSSKRPWSAIMLANYKTLRWTTECSNIQQLQDMLKVHTNSINLTMQALQTGSLGRLEKTVEPMAENIAGIHALLSGDLGQKIDDVHRFIMAVANGTPSLRARGDSVDHRSYRSPSVAGNGAESPFLLESASLEPSPWNLDAGSHAAGRVDSVVGSPSSWGSGRLRLSSSSDFSAIGQARRRYERDGSISSLLDFETTSTPQHPTLQSPKFHLRSPLIPSNSATAIPPATPWSLLISSPSGAPDDRRSPLTPDVECGTLHSRPCFEHQLFQHATVLSDSKVTLVEYTKRNSDVSDTRYETETITLCGKSHLCVIRKRENCEHGGTTAFTSIWILSDDGTIRCQQKLPNDMETVPHCSFFEPGKISVVAPTADELTLRCHSADWSDAVEKEIKTSWMNYVFADPFDAAAFQSAVFGRTLLGSFRTSKTTVLHGGIKGAFTFEEQFGKLDRLRIWRDSNMGVLALMHVSSTFGDGWTRFWLNNSRQQVYIRKDGERCVRVKGLDIAVPGSIPVTSGPARRSSVLEQHIGCVETTRTLAKRVSGLPIEFETVSERGEFLALSRQVQESMLPLP